MLNKHGNTQPPPFFIKIMQTISVIKSVTYYPLPQNVVEKFALERGLDLDAEYSTEIAESNAYKNCLADVYKWLSLAPSSISENGVTISFTNEDKRRFVELANELYDETGEELIKCKYGYKGSRF